MSLMLFILLLPFSSYVAALSFIQGEWEINNTQSGAIFSAYLAGFALAALFVIPLTDRLPPRYIFIISASISVAANVLFPRGRRPVNASERVAWPDKVAS